MILDVADRSGHLGLLLWAPLYRFPLFLLSHIPLGQVWTESAEPRGHSLNVPTPWHSGYSGPHMLKLLPTLVCVMGLRSSECTELLT